MWVVEKSSRKNISHTHNNFDLNIILHKKYLT
jgi:hypothetical protein